MDFTPLLTMDNLTEIDSILEKLDTQLTELDQGLQDASALVEEQQLFDKEVELLRGFTAQLTENRDELSLKRVLKQDEVVQKRRKSLFEVSTDIQKKSFLIILLRRERYYLRLIKAIIEKHDAGKG